VGIYYLYIFNFKDYHFYWDYIPGKSSFYTVRSEYLRDCDVLLDTKIEVEDKTRAKKLGKPRGDISFQNVNFSYDGKRQVLRGINMDVKA